MALTKKITEGKEMYAGKAAMMKHEKKEPMKKEMKEEKSMAKRGAKSPAIALIIGVAKPKGKTTMMSKGGMSKGKK